MPWPAFETHTVGLERAESIHAPADSIHVLVPMSRDLCNGFVVRVVPGEGEN